MADAIEAYQLEVSGNKSTVKSDGYYCKAKDGSVYRKEAVITSCPRGVGISKSEYEEIVAANNYCQMPNGEVYGPALNCRSNKKITYSEYLDALIAVHNDASSTTEVETEASDLPKCPGSYGKNTWTNCVGTLTLSDGTTYVGEFNDNEFHGQGTATFPPWDDIYTHGSVALVFHPRKHVGLLGGKYIGEWDEGFWHGQGTLTLSNGNSYVGEFTDNTFHGQGTYTHASGSVLEGVWEWGKFISPSKPSSDKAKEENAVSSGDDPLEAKLEKLQKLLDKGLITEEEAAAKRAKLLEDL